MADFVRDHINRHAVELEPTRLYTARDIEELTGIKAGSIRADKSKGRWPQPDDTSGRADKWLGSTIATIATALSGRRGYHVATTDDDCQEPPAEPATAFPATTGSAQPGPEGRVHTITTLHPIWKPGDVVLDAEGALRVRATDNVAYPWGYPDEGGLRDKFGDLSRHDGGLRDEDLRRPLILLVRDGQPIGGRLIEE
ncbi:hypothetical protein IF655_05750 [Streptomyces sp. DSM 110735]|uniref:hypothetical protein n=1 Tax=Streptomyces sp. DSM 110735 TaxID=2775031 RepID=UPI0018F33A23|nr:hypothetical protein [Streptomyces sp. DSM 110735]MBJ7902799.1 hypothetical protein [Streptomyces sp. DSM 110735]